MEMTTRPAVVILIEREMERKGGERNKTFSESAANFLFLFLCGESRNTAEFLPFFYFCLLSFSLSKCLNVIIYLTFPTSGLLG